jgi:hypothetical protein
MQDMSKSLKERLQNLVDTLPSKPVRNPEGGWLPPDPKNLNAFYELVSDAARHIFGVDEDDDSCVIVNMTDRTRFEKVHVLPVPVEIEDSNRHPYGKRKWEGNGLIDKKHTPEEEEARRVAILQNKRRRIRTILGNLQMASSKVDQLGNLLDYDIQKELERPARERAKRIKELERIQNIWSDPEAWVAKRKHKDVFYDPASVPPSIRDIKLVGEGQRKPLLKPDNYDALMEELERLKAYKDPELEEED